nr:reverse transcriptase domain-containing protein [Pleurocapsa sp. FMAR1]
MLTLPAHEATFHAKSYGFRPGRSTHDAQKVLFLNLNSKANGAKKRVLKIDIEKCFDRINHAAILNEIGVGKSKYGFSILYQTLFKKSLKLHAADAAKSSP